MSTSTGAFGLAARKPQEIFPESHSSTSARRRCRRWPCAGLRLDRLHQYFRREHLSVGEQRGARGTGQSSSRALSQRVPRVRPSTRCSPRCPRRRRRFPRPRPFQLRLCLTKGLQPRRRKATRQGRSKPRKSLKRHRRRRRRKLSQLRSRWNHRNLPKRRRRSKRPNSRKYQRRKLPRRQRPPRSRSTRPRRLLKPSPLQRHQGLPSATWRSVPRQR